MIDVFLDLLETAVLAPTRNALRSLSATDAGFWLVQPGALEAAPAFGVVLLDRLPGLLVALGAEVLGRG